jgi:hypothetical protein
MMYLIKIGEEEVVVNNAQMQAMLDTLWGAQVKKQEWVGSGKGDNGENYTEVLRPYVPHTMLRPFVMHPDTADALAFKTKVFDESKKK